MKKPIEISDIVLKRLDELFNHIVNEFNAPATAHKYIEEINEFLQKLGNGFALAKCRRKKWREKGYRYAVFDRCWVFAYQIYDDRVIIHDMEYTANITDVDF
jgi:plasmid stabilization system protein ParE